MKPGVTTSPWASRVVFAVAWERSPIAAIVSPVIPTSARTRGLPVPSMT